ncbi:hypothetical protein ABIE41_001441 [Bosea sp. OAE506]
MDVKMRGRRRQLTRHHTGLAEAAQTVARAITGEVAQEDRQQPQQTGPHQRAQDAAQHPPGLLMQILRQIVYRHADLVVHQVACGIGRAPQRPDREGQAALLQAEQFLRDEGLRQARIALHRDRDDRLRHRRPISMKRV